MRACSQTIITAILTMYKQHGPLRSSKGSGMASVQLSLLPFNTWEDFFFCGGEGDGQEILLTLAKMSSYISRTHPSPPSPPWQPLQPAFRNLCTYAQSPPNLDEMITSTAATSQSSRPWQGITGLPFARLHALAQVRNTTCEVRLD